MQNKIINLKIYIFYLLLSLNTIFIGLIFLPLAIFSRYFAIKCGYFWAYFSLKIIKYCLNIDYKINNSEIIPKKSSFIVSNHQSAYETIFYLYYFKDPIFLLKKELKYLPVIGFYCWRMGMVFIDRKKPTKAIKEISKNISLITNRKIIIFPEGTRIKYGEKRKFKNGIFSFSQKINIPITPVAHNAGKFWPKGFYNKTSGVVIFNFLDNYQKNNNKIDFIKNLEQLIFKNIK